MSLEKHTWPLISTFLLLASQIANYTHFFFQLSQPTFPNHISPPPPSFFHPAPSSHPLLLLFTQKLLNYSYLATKEISRPCYSFKLCNRQTLWPFWLWLLVQAFSHMTQFYFGEGVFSSVKLSFSGRLPHQKQFLNCRMHGWKCCAFTLNCSRIAAPWNHESPNCQVKPSGK